MPRSSTTEHGRPGWHSGLPRGRTSQGLLVRRLRGPSGVAGSAMTCGQVTRRPCPNKPIGVGLRVAALIHVQ
eukprot:3049894-Alexandrium_andersonii.AAC.1